MGAHGCARTLIIIIIVGGGGSGGGRFGRRARRPGVRLACVSA